MTKIRDKYYKEALPEMKKKFNLGNDFEVPKILKVVVNCGVGKLSKDNSQVTDAVEALKMITGQKPVMTKARLSIAGFKLREGSEVGIKVTMRGARMWDFLEKLVGAALPRVRDFRGVKASVVDKSGNLNIGIREHLIFPEVLPENVRNSFGFQVNVVTTAKNQEEGMALFRLLGFPIEK